MLKKFSDQAEDHLPPAVGPREPTIDAYHIRNEAAKGKAEGVPEPGTFILDQAGVVRAKLFLEASAPATRPTN